MDMNENADDMITRQKVKREHIKKAKNAAFFYVF